jgi:hypothetical protein
MCGGGSEAQQFPGNALHFVIELMIFTRIMEVQVNTQSSVKGSWLVLFGAVWYLSEWIFIFGFGKRAPALDSTTRELAAWYTANYHSVIVYMIAMSAAILGRLLFISALREGLSEHRQVKLFLDMAFALAVVAVAVETVSYGLDGLFAAMLGSTSAEVVSTAAALLHLNHIFADVLNLPHGLFAAACGLAMLRVRHIPRWTAWLGILGGLGFAVSVHSGFYSAAVESTLSLVQIFSWFLIAIWMLVTGVIMGRGVRVREHAMTESPLALEGERR